MSDYKQHPEYKALLRSVFETPHDMAPRLILSDWIEEHDDPERAEEIRNAIRAYDAGETAFKKAEFIKTGYSRVSQAEIWTARSEQELNAANERYKYPIVISEILACSRRGFIEHVECTFDELAENYAIFNEYPIVSVSLTGVNPLTDLERYPETLNGFHMQSYVMRQLPSTTWNDEPYRFQPFCIDWCRIKCGLPPLEH